MDRSTEELPAILQANESFYDALTARDLPSMEAVWSHDPAARCIHPGWEVIEGWDVIRQSWDIIFSNTRNLKVEASEVQVRVGGDLAWVCCLESIRSGPRGRVTLARATNLFVRTSSGWKMILHHASQVPPEARNEGSGEDEPIVH